jgi:hypothetical protein
MAEGKTIPSGFFFKGQLLHLLLLAVLIVAVMGLPSGSSVQSRRQASVSKVRGESEPVYPFLCHEEESVYSGKGGPSCDTTTLTNGHFFRDDEQAAAWIPVRDTGKAWHTGRPRRQGAGREARAQ